MYIYIYIYTNTCMVITGPSGDVQGGERRRGRPFVLPLLLRPISLLTLWISEGLTPAQS